MIAIGGAIGTGLFVASGASIAHSGPGGAVVAYLLVGAMVYCLMSSLGEMAAFLPVSGSFATYCATYVEEGFGFALGWNYWFCWAITISAELAAAQLVMQYWFPHVPGWYWGALFLVVLFAVNAVKVHAFGEFEYALALVKVVAIVAFICIGLLMVAGVMSGTPGAGWRTFTGGEGPFVGGLGSIAGVAIIAGFSFGGSELVGIAAGESEQPSRTIPRAIRLVFWRILLFYVFTICIIGMLVPYSDPNLLKRNVADISVSPFALVFRQAGLPFAAGVMNLVVLTAVLSAANSGMYASARMLFTLSVERKAPKAFRRLTRNGVPFNALFATLLVSALSFLTSLYDSKTVYLWLLNTAGLAGFMTWLGIAITHYRFRRGFVSQGYRLDQLAYHAPWFPYGTMFGLSLCLILIFGQDYQAFLAHRIDWLRVLATYVDVVVFFVTWGGYRLVRRSRFVSKADMPYGPRLERAAVAGRIDSSVPAMD